MEPLSEETIKILKQSGWYPGRNIDIQDTIDFLLSKRYTLFPHLIKILSEFSEIEYKFDHPNGRIESFHMIPKMALGDYYEKEDFEEIERRVNEPLIPIGEACRGNMIMFLSETGKIYGETGYYLEKFGDNVYEALENLCLFKQGEEIE